MGQSVTFEYTITADNAAGSSTSEIFTITLQGTNDDPVITPASVADLEISAVPNDRMVTRMFLSDDVDTGDTATWSVDTSTSGEGPYGSLSVDSNTGLGTFTFLAAGEEAFDALPGSGAGSSVTLTYKVTANDGSGGTHEVDFNIVLQGADDSPVLGEVTTPPAVKTAIEVGHEVAGTAAMGSFTHTDIDAGQGAFVGGTVHIKAASALDNAYAAGLGNNAGNNIIDGTDRGTAVFGTYGTIYLRADGDWYYVLDDANANVNALPAGASSLEDVFDVRIQETVDSTIVSNVLELRIAITGT